MLDALLERFVLSQERIADALHALTRPAAETVPQEVPKRTRASVPKDPPPVQQAKPIDPVVLPSQPMVPVEELRQSVIKLGTSGAAGKAEVINILTKFGVKKATEAPPEVWGQIKEACDASMKLLEGEDFA